MNKNWRKGGPSPNPGGRPKIAEHLRAKCIKAVDEHVVDAWIEEVVPSEREVAVGNRTVVMFTRGANWVRCSELLAAYAIGKPAQTIQHEGKDGEDLEITVKFVDAKRQP